MSSPSFQLEQDIQGRVCGLDEVGRGPLAGPVVAACVYIPEEHYTLPFVGEIKDSKKLSDNVLKCLDDAIRTHFVFAVFEIPPEEIDQINILQASLKAMSCALAQMDMRVDHALVDGNRCPKDLPCPSTAVIKGDSISTSIAAASIVAKAHRDNIMRALHDEHPYYGWGSNVGYPTQAHLDGIDAHGITGHHRKSFAPVRRFLENGQTRKSA